MMRDADFADKFVFIEDYDINVGRHLVQGVDVWLNNPRRPLEASGTSGMKVVLNGGLNLSVLDGWWAEAYDGLNGFAIGTGRTHSNMDVHDSRDGEALYRVLLDEVIPLYYQPRSRRAAAGLDQAHEADDPHAGMALQRRPHGDGLHAEVLHSGGGRHVERSADAGVEQQALRAGLPLAANAEDVELLIIADQCQVFVDGLRSNHAVEWVFVLGRKTASPKSVLETDGQWQITCRLNDRNEIVNESLRQGELAQTILRCDFPCGSGRDEDFVPLRLNQMTGTG